MSILRYLIPRPARIIMHPLGATKRALTPRPIRKLGQARHLIGTLTSAATLDLVGHRRRRPTQRHPATLRAGMPRSDKVRIVFAVVFVLIMVAAIAPHL